MPQQPAVAQAVADWLLSSDSEEDDARSPAQRHARVPQQPAAAQARRPVAAVAQAGQRVAAGARGWLSSDSEEDVPQQPAVAQAGQRVAAAAQAAAPRIAQRPALQLEDEAAPAAGAQAKPLSALAAHFEAVKQQKAAAEASQVLRRRYAGQSLEEVLRQEPEQPPTKPMPLSQEQGHKPSKEARRKRQEGAEPAVVAGAVAATAVVPPTSGPRAAAVAQIGEAQSAGARRAGAQPTTAQPAAAQPEKAQLQRRNEQLLEERPMRGPPRDEQFAASPLAIGMVGLSLNEAFAAECAKQAGQPIAARSGLEDLLANLEESKKKMSDTTRYEIGPRIDMQRVALDNMHNAQRPELESFSPPPLVALCLQAVRDEPRLHAAVASWDLACRRDGDRDDGKTSELLEVQLLEVLQDHMGKYRELWGRLLVPYTDDDKASEVFGVLRDHKDKYRQLRGRLLVPYTINRYLYDYQREGARFLADIYTGRRHAPGEEIKGGILADEMGLGKTIQVIGELRLPGLGRADTDSR
jgi:hypothetical protein